MSAPSSPPSLTGDQQRLVSVYTAILDNPLDSSQAKSHASSKLRELGVEYAPKPSQNVPDRRGLEEKA
ncbi:hypothetical protein FA15DRAFT_700080 [Coprinopsis marcescibilis]|uniref:Uncharacterized protein n=1 Tax=Coprinopsis marcescibilis TaxID=230819 RepID=A0A5C3L8Y0_COPMA|nr:hypothetical protein FA15DRAFT_700080 [Coprinopsis marcescibilis]